MKIFLSSTYKDLIEYRLAAAEAIERLGQQGVRMEVFGARPNDATNVCFEEISNSDVLVGIYAHRYGHIPVEQTTSITEQEFEFARSEQKPVFCFIVDEDHPWPPKHIDSEPLRTSVASFKMRIQNLVVTTTFTTPSDLAFKVATSLGHFLIERRVRENLDQMQQNSSVGTEYGRSQVARRVTRLERVIKGAKVLLVNDVPAQMNYVVKLLRELGIEVRIAEDTLTALAFLREFAFDAIISDMERHGIQDEGMRFLKTLRDNKFDTPVILTVGRYKPDLGTPAYAFGITNRIEECLNLLFDILERVRG